ncbi:hypothetical protein [Neorickettsia sennetsu]|uniref:hypothetical protein n=1 Tax=Ehrlichia sennetsu TaxID=951 RepID=UPI0003074641|nr:hypothetical protein [Neorickettsia sennetsu]
MDNPTGKQGDPPEHVDEEQNNQTQQGNNAEAASSNGEGEVFQEAEGATGGAGAQQDAPQPPEGEQGAVGGVDAQQDAEAGESSSNGEEEIFQEAEGATGGTGAQQDAPQPPEEEQGAVGGAPQLGNQEPSPSQELARLLTGLTDVPRKCTPFQIICAAGFAYAIDPQTRIFFRRHLLRTGRFDWIFPRERAAQRRVLERFMTDPRFVFDMLSILFGMFMAMYTIVKMCLWCIVYLMLDAIGVFEDHDENGQQPPPHGGLNEARVGRIDQGGRNHN